MDVSPPHTSGATGGQGSPDQHEQGGVDTWPPLFQPQCPAWPPATSCLSGLSGPIGPCGAPEPRWVAVDGLATRSSHGPGEMATAEQ